MNCQYCDSFCKKDGKQKDGTQKYRCKTCFKYQQGDYSYNGCTRVKKSMISLMREKQYSLSSIARSLNLSINTVVKEDRNIKSLQQSTDRIKLQSLRYVP